VRRGEPMRAANSTATAKGGGRSGSPNPQPAYINFFRIEPKHSLRRLGSAPTHAIGARVRARLQPESRGRHGVQAATRPLLLRSARSRQRSAVGGTVAGVILLVVAAVVLLLVSCGGSEPEPPRAASPDPKHLVVRLSDLPPQYSLLPGEAIPISLASVLADPWSAGLEAEIKRERVSGFQTSVWNPERRRIQCSVSVYRSSTGARQILEHSRFRSRAFFAAHRVRSTPVGALGEDARASRLDLGRLKGLTIGWRHASVLAACSMLGHNPPAFAELMEVVSAQHRRLATTLG
jgi:hypothetical protein